MKVNVFLFDDFETLDVFGPVEILARVEDFSLEYVSSCGGMVLSAQKTPVMTKKMEDADKSGIFLIPGGRGTRPLSKNSEELEKIKSWAESASYVLSVCTGSALLAASGVLGGKRATSNKKAFDWAMSCNETVLWQRRARWCVDGKFYTSSGVSAGIDMSLGFVADMFGREKSIEIAENIEYLWNSNPSDDPFCRRFPG